MNRRKFLKGGLGAVAALVVAPVLAKDRVPGPDEAPQIFTSTADKSVFTRTIVTSSSNPVIVVSTHSLDPVICGYDIVVNDEVAGCLNGPMGWYYHQANRCINTVRVIPFEATGARRLSLSGEHFRLVEIKR